METGAGTRRGVGPVMNDRFDVSLEDGDLLAEVELTTNLIIAATQAEEPLSTAEIDRILGVVPPSQPGPRD